MTTSIEAQISGQTVAPTNGRGAALMSESDLAEVMGAFNDVTAKLQGSHEALRCEVSRLQAELREANEQIERSRRLAALGEMAAGIAHEVRNPLGSIKLYARMLEEDLERAAGFEEQRKVAIKIGAAVRSVDAVVQDVLSFAREVKVKIEPFDVEELIGRGVEDAINSDRAEHSRRRPVEIIRRDQARLNRTIECDQVLVQRAIANVIGNAVQAVRERETLEPGSELVVVIDLLDRRTVASDDGASEHVAISVADTGHGVSHEVMERMFNPFFTTRATGTGLGLAIVHRIMDAHGGQVLVRNRGVEEGGMGAVVELRFAARSPGLCAVTRPRGPASSFGIGKVDDVGQVGDSGGNMESRVAKRATRKNRVTENAA